MARYDRRMQRYDEHGGYGGYGRDYGGPDWPGRGRSEWLPGARAEYDRAGGYPGPWGGQVGGGEMSGWPEPVGGVYGPARYGLGPYYQRLLERRRPDDELRDDVEEALFYDTWVDAEAISVEVEDGVVTLRGELPDYDEIRYAIDDAWDVDGVRGVRGELGIRRQTE